MHLRDLALIAASFVLPMGGSLLPQDHHRSGVAIAAEASHGGHDSGSRTEHEGGHKGKGGKQFKGGKGDAGHGSRDDGHKGNSGHAGGSKTLESEIMHAEEAGASKQVEQSR